MRLLPIQIGLRASEAALPLCLAGWFGRSHRTDTLYLLWAIFGLGGALLAGLFRDSALVPILVRLRTVEPHALRRVLAAVLGHTLVGGTLVGLGFALATLLWLGPAWPGGADRLAFDLILPFALHLLALGVRGLLEAVLHADRRFVVAASGGALGTVVALVTMALSHRAGVAVVPWALLLGELCAITLLARRTQLARWGRPTLARPPVLLEFGRRALYETAGGMLTRLNPIVDQAMAVALGLAGGGTLLRLSGDVAGVSASLLQASLLPVLLGRLAFEHVSGAAARHRRTVHRTLLATGLVLAAGALLLFLGRDLVMRAAFSHGEMDAAAAHDLAALLPYHLVGVVPFGALLVLARAHVSLGNSRIMLPMGALNCAANLLFNLTLAPFLGLRGLALSTSLVSALIALAFYFLLLRRYAEEHARRPSYAEAA